LKKPCRDPVGLFCVWCFVRGGSQCHTPREADQVIAKPIDHSVS